MTKINPRITAKTSCTSTDLDKTTTKFQKDPAKTEEGVAFTRFNTFCDRQSQTNRHTGKTTLSVGDIITTNNFLGCLKVKKRVFHYKPNKASPPYLNRGSYMSVHVLLNLLNELGKRDKMRGLPSILSLFRNEFNKFNNTRA